MPSFSSSVETMSAAAAHVGTVQQDITQQLGALRNNLQALEGQWVGSAQAAFSELMTRWDADARKLSDALQGIQTALSQSANTYSTTEDTNKSAISKIMGGLG